MSWSREENIESYLKNEIEGDIALIGLLTKHGLASDWVLFEAGSSLGKRQKDYSDFRPWA